MSQTCWTPVTWDIAVSIVKSCEQFVARVHLARYHMHAWAARHNTCLLIIFAKKVQVFLFFCFLVFSFPVLSVLFCSFLV